MKLSGVIQSKICIQCQRVKICGFVFAMGLFHMVAILSPEGLKTFVLHNLNSLPNHINQRLGVSSLL